MTVICYFCGRSFNNNGPLEIHMISHINKVPHICNQKGCKKSYRRFEDLRVHLKKVHSLTLTTNRENLNSSRKVSCYFCSEEFKIPYLLNIHLLRVHTLERPLKCKFVTCNKRFLDNSTIKHHEKICEFNPHYYLFIATKRTQSISERTCYFCYKVSSAKNTLFEHLKIHTLEKTRKCAGCEVTFDYIKYSKHSRYCENLLLKHQCSFCGVKMKLFSNLQDHIQYVHTKDLLKINCYFCNAKFRPKDIRSHMSKHTKERPNICEYCNKELSQKFCLRKHIINKHPKTKEGIRLIKLCEKPCYFCSKSYPFPSGLESHMKYHTKEDFK